MQLSVPSPEPLRAAVEWRRSPYRLFLAIPVLPPMNAGAMRRHRMVLHRETSRLRALVVALIGRRKPWLQGPLRAARLVALRHSSVMADRPNVAISMKPLVDGLVDAKVLWDDSPGVLLEEIYDWRPAPANAGGVSLLVEELGAMTLAARQGPKGRGYQRDGNPSQSDPLVKLGPRP